MLSVKNLKKTFHDASEASGIEFVLSKDGDVIMSTLHQMEYEEVFLSALARCWKGFDIFTDDALQYQIYTYEQCNAVVVSCCGAYLVAGVANHSIPIGELKAVVFSLRDGIEEEFGKLNDV
ncbi:hypothetical protein WA588_000690 [Blastocystis sp. NMH]